MRTKASNGVDWGSAPLVHTGPKRRWFTIGAVLLVAGSVLGSTAVYAQQAGLDTDAEDFVQVAAGQDTAIELEAGPQSVWVENIEAATEGVATTAPGSGDPEGQLGPGDGVQLTMTDPTGAQVRLDPSESPDFQITRGGVALEGTAGWNFDAEAGTHLVSVRSGNPFVRGIAIGPEPDPYAARAPAVVGAGLVVFAVVVLAATVWLRSRARKRMLVG